MQLILFQFQAWVQTVCNHTGPRKRRRRARRKHTQCINIPTRSRLQPMVFSIVRDNIGRVALPDDGGFKDPQIQPGYPQVSTYYAPVAVVPMQQPMVSMQQPMVSMQQPMVSMPQPYVPVQNVVPAPVIPSVPPAAAPVQMPEPTTNNQAAPPPVIPDGSGFGVPPPPIITDTPAGDPPSRPRFTNFYRPADPPVSMPEPHVSDIPYRPPTVPPVRSQRNPLPSPPRDIWETTPYRQVLRELPKDITLSLDVEHMQEMENLLTQPAGSTSRFGSLFGSSKRNGKSRKGLFRAFSTSGSESDSGRRHHRSNTVTSFVIPASAAIPHGTNPGPQPMPAPERGPPIRFNHTGELSGFVNHSPHRILHRNKMYPTAMHLLEAMKFTAHPEIQERIRTCKDVGDMYPLSASFQQYVRPDWGQVFLNTVRLFHSDGLAAL